MAVTINASHGPLAGEVVCLGSSLIWAFTIHLYRPPILAHGPRAVNLLKCVLAALFFGLTLLALGQVGELLAAPPGYIGLLIISGFIGFSIGDSALFSAVPAIGIHRTQLIQTLAPVFTTVIAYLCQGETISGIHGVGTLLILGGLIVVVSPRAAGAAAGTAPGKRVDEVFDVTIAGRKGQARTLDPNRNPRLTVGWGIGMATLAALCQGSQIVISKKGLEQVPILPASFVRLATGALGLLVISGLGGGLRRAGRALRSRRTMLFVVPGTFLGSYIGIVFMMAGLAWAPASIAAFLLATTPVFTMIIGAVNGEEPFTWRAGVGTAITVAGVGLLTAA